MDARRLADEVIAHWPPTGCDINTHRRQRDKVLHHIQNMSPVLAAIVAQRFMDTFSADQGQQNAFGRELQALYERTPHVGHRVKSTRTHTKLCTRTHSDVAIPAGQEGEIVAVSQHSHCGTFAVLWHGDGGHITQYYLDADNPLRVI